MYCFRYGLYVCVDRPHDVDPLTGEECRFDWTEKHEECVGKWFAVSNVNRSDIRLSNGLSFPWHALCLREGDTFLTTEPVRVDRTLPEGVYLNDFLPEMEEILRDSPILTVATGNRIYREYGVPLKAVNGAIYRYPASQITPLIRRVSTLKISSLTRVERQKVRNGESVVGVHPIDARDWRDRLHAMIVSMKQQMVPKLKGRWARRWCASSAALLFRQGAEVAMTLRSYRQLERSGTCDMSMYGLFNLEHPDKAILTPCQKNIYVRLYNVFINGSTRPLYHLRDLTKLPVYLCPSDYKQVVFVRSYKDLLFEGGPRWTSMRLGRFLRYYCPHLSDAEVKRLVEEHEAEHKPPEVRWVENTDPDGWEWVYENGSGFSSCMTYDRDGRYLDSNLGGEYHPARVYAYPGNGLRLAYVQKNGKVVARSIVVEPNKTYVRVYGDERLKLALENLGYKESRNLTGVKLVKRIHPSYGWCVIAPYLDCRSGFAVEEDCLVVGRGSCLTSAVGYSPFDD